MDKAVGVEITEEAGVGVVGFKSASISDVEGIAAAAAQIKEYIEEKHPKEMVVDFGGVKFFSSQVLGMLLDIRAKLAPYDGEVVISAINPQLYRVFKITNLDKIFRFYQDRQSAIKASKSD